MAGFYTNAIRAFTRLDPAGTQVLDFGCGKGDMVMGLREASFAAEGCDIKQYWTDDPHGLFRLIERDPYRLPYADAAFDVMLSSQVFEHAHNKRQCFEEIRRVLKPGCPLTKLFLVLPLRALWEWLFRACRMAFLLQRKRAAEIPNPAADRTRS